MNSYGLTAPTLKRGLRLSNLSFNIALVSFDRPDFEKGIETFLQGKSKLAECLTAPTLKRGLRLAVISGVGIFILFDRPDFEKGIETANNEILTWPLPV